MAADSFQSAMVGNITEVCWWGLYADFDPVETDCGPGPGDDFTITYYEVGNEGLPGAVHAGPFAVQANTILSGNTVGGFLEYQHSAIHDPVPVDADECLWLEIKNNLDGKCVWNWRAGQPGNNSALQSDSDDGIYSAADEVGNDLAWCFNVPIADPLCPNIGIPVANAWGFSIMTLVLMSAGICVMRSRRRYGDG